ncbi:MAS20-domain-containing protein [Auricularia subglabra TFB-10046 SS5]|nr:MAS20-domain-containing protein [Auricularia subglabra TFB-10046 SS5]
MSTPERSTATRALVIAGATVLGGLAAYALYFDYKRRNDAQFRKQLRKEHKRVKRAKTETAAAAAAASVVGDEELKAALLAIREEQMPESTQERELYFTHNISEGERLGTQGPAVYLESALYFYRALRVYPQPVELIMIYQKTVPEPVFNILMKLTTLDVKNRGEDYYESFPPPSMNVAIKRVESKDADGRAVLKNVLVATKDFAVGETIYTEFPMAAALDSDLEGNGTHCSQCLRKLQGITPIRVEDDPLQSAYCSQDCQDLAHRTHHGLLFGLGPLVSIDPDPPAPGPRRAAQTALAQLLRKSGHTRPLLALRLFAAQVMHESARVVPLIKPDEPPPPPSILPEPVGPHAAEYKYEDHVERLRYLEMDAPEEETAAMRAVFAAALNAPDAKDFIPDERYNVLKGKVAYNAIGVVFGGGRDRKVRLPKHLTDLKDGAEIEYARTPLGVQREVGAAVYRVSSYLTHSCTPSVRPTFPKGTYELHLVASRSIAKDEELTMAYVEVARRPEEDAYECWGRRRAQLVDGWRFVCYCARCVEEQPKKLKELDAATIKLQDESKVEDTVRKFETAAEDSG